jgi:aldose sugar dehydrogenase
MDFIEGEIYKNWNGNLMVASLVFRYLERCVISDEKVIHREKLLEGIGRVRNVKQGPDGYIYIATEVPGGIYKLIPVD